MEFRQKLAGNWLASLPLPGSASLDPAVRRVYARESLVNFRSISRICATRSRRPLTKEDRVSLEIALELSEIGQFAELAYTPIPITYVLKNLDSLTREHFPLEGYDALNDAVLITHTHGAVADVQTFVVYRPQTKQVVAAFSGTANLAQCIYDLNLTRHHYHNGTLRRGRVHHGFWKMFKGLRQFIMRAIEAACAQFEVEELVLTGHSLGGALAYLFGLEVLAASYDLPKGIKIKVATFGAPRIGDEELAKYWNELVDGYRALYGPDAVVDYCVKGHRDGVPAIPPTSFGYRHFCREPLFSHDGKVYRVPASEREHALFDFPRAEDDAPAMYPRGGHNYYNGRSLENVFRRLQFLEKILDGGSAADAWEDRYLRRVHKYEGAVQVQQRKSSMSMFPMRARAASEPPDRPGVEEGGSSSTLVARTANTLPCKHVQRLEDARSRLIITTLQDSALGLYTVIQLCYLIIFAMYNRSLLYRYARSACTYMLSDIIILTSSVLRGAREWRDVCGRLWACPS